MLRAYWTTDALDAAGPHYRVEQGGLLRPSSPLPTLYLGGASAIAEEVAARQADVYLTWGEAPRRGPRAF